MTFNIRWWVVFVSILHFCRPSPTFCTAHNSWNITHSHTHTYISSEFEVRIFKSIYLEIGTQKSALKSKQAKVIWFNTLAHSIPWHCHTNDTLMSSLLITFFFVHFSRQLFTMWYFENAISKEFEFAEEEKIDLEKWENGFSKKMDSKGNYH